MKFTIETTNVKKPITHDKIYKIMRLVTIIAASAFFVKNVISLNVAGMLVIGACLAGFLMLLYTMKVRKTKQIVKEFTVSMCLIVIILLISLFSGESYSDDFPLYLAAIGMTGMYLEPKFTLYQTIAADVALIVMYLIHPEKAGSLGQYILCFVIFTLAAWLFYMAITRGRAFIEMTFEKEAETREVLESMKRMGDEIQNDFTESSKQIEERTSELEKGSMSIINETVSVVDSCGDVHEKIQVTEQNIQNLNSQVKVFENALSENHENVEAMKNQLKEVISIINETNTVFSEMKHKINSVANIAQELSAISMRTTILSLNAAVEASHAGDAGIGFAVVASEMKSLSESSDEFANQVAEAVKDLLEEVDKTNRQFNGTTAAIEKSEDMMTGLQDGFVKLTEQFGELYENIEEQNKNVAQVDDIFSELKNKINYMRNYSEENHESVREIVKAMDGYRENIGRVVSNTKGE